jgi:hypothetical protein
MAAGANTKRLTTQSAQWSGNDGEATTGSTAGERTWKRSCTGGARFTGASASLKAVSGESARGATETPAAAPNTTRINIVRRRITLAAPIFQRYSRGVCLSMALPSRLRLSSFSRNDSRGGSLWTLRLSSILRFLSQHWKLWVTQKQSRVCGELLAELDGELALGRGHLAP